MVNGSEVNLETQCLPGKMCQRDSSSNFEFPRKHWVQRKQTVNINSYCKTTKNTDGETKNKDSQNALLPCVKSNRRKETQIRGEGRQKTRKRVQLVERETQRSSRAGRGVQEKRGKVTREHNIIQKKEKMTKKSAWEHKDTPPYSLTQREKSHIEPVRVADWHTSFWVILEQDGPIGMADWMAKAGDRAGVSGRRRDNRRRTVETRCRTMGSVSTPLWHGGRAVAPLRDPCVSFPPKIYMLIICVKNDSIELPYLSCF